MSRKKLNFKSPSMGQISLPLSTKTKPSYFSTRKAATLHARPVGPHLQSTPAHPVRGGNFFRTFSGQNVPNALRCTGNTVSAVMSSSVSATRDRDSTSTGKASVFATPPQTKTADTSPSQSPFMTPQPGCLFSLDYYSYFSF